jgi:Replication-relaxation
MSTRAATKLRSSRWSRDPVITGGKPTVARLTERDFQIFSVLARYRYLPSNDIHALVGGNSTALAARLNLLSRRPNLFLNRPTRQRENASANHCHLVYELDERGAAALRARGAAVPPKAAHRNFAHELMICRIMASIDLGVRADPAIRFISWAEILANGHTPAATRASDRPASIPVSFEFRGERLTTEVRADAAPFGLERRRNGERTFLFFPGIEVDCGSEPITASDSERSSIFKKFVAYRAIAEQAIYRSHFGFPNFFVPFVCSDGVRLTSMMKLLERITEGKGSRMFLFKEYPAFSSFNPPPPANGHVLIEPWQRVGFPPLSLHQ